MSLLYFIYMESHLFTYLGYLHLAYCFLTICFCFFSPLEIFSLISLIWRHHDYRQRYVNFDLNSALMVNEQWGFYCTTAGTNYTLAYTNFLMQWKFQECPTLRINMGLTKKNQTQESVTWHHIVKLTSF